MAAVETTTGPLAQTPVPRAPDFPPRPYAIYVVFVLLIVTLISLLDRQLPALLVKPIKGSLKITDTEFSLLQGTAFAVFYTVMGIPLGRAVDKLNRRNVILSGMAAWSAMTVCSGLVATYGQLFLARIGVGIGEACLAPAAYSIIADYFPPLERARAISTYYISLSLGTGASMAIGGALLPHLPAAGVSLPIVGTLLPWKLMFIILGLPGLVAIPLLLTVREPKRLSGAALDAAAAKGTFLEFLRYVGRHLQTFLSIILSASAIGVIGYATLAWAPTFFERRFGVGVAQSGPILGLIFAGTGVVGALVSGYLSDRWTAKGVKAARFRVVALAWLIFLPAAVLWPFAPTPFSSYLILALAIAMSALAQSAGPVILQEIVPNRMRGQAIAVYLLIAGLLALGFGPTAPALLTDHVFHNEKDLGTALSVIALIAGALGAGAAWSGLKPYSASWNEIVNRSSVL